jgi:hypothetical protein
MLKHVLWVAIFLSMPAFAGKAHTSHTSTKKAEEIQAVQTKESAYDTLSAAEAAVAKATQELQDFRASPMPVIEAQQQLYQVTLAAKEEALERAQFDYQQALKAYQDAL